MMEISLYIHIPFCARKCRYCDFYSVSVDNLSFVNQYIDALGREWAGIVDSGMVDGAVINTVYVGGGTPSLLGVDMWGRLDDVLFSRIDKSNISEWSVECNPESFSIDKARVYAGCGVTRLTFGVQSLNPRELSICGRVHSADRAREVLGDNRIVDMFKSTGVDIMYGLPGQTVNTLDDTLTSILSFPAVKHISAYELTIADDTPFGHHHKILPLPTEDLSSDMYELINKRCTDRGMYQYEISNYAIPGFESVHNKAYWSHKPYIGLGASAHSYIHPKRWSNVADAGQYISSISSARNAIIFEETITPTELAEEILFLGLRNAGGIDEDDFFQRTGIRLSEKSLQKYAGSGLLVKSGRKYVPASRGMLFADMMARGLMT